MTAELRELNQFLVSFDLDGAGFSGFRRLFHEGGVKGFDFQWGGRLYGVGDFNYQSMRKTDRPLHLSYALAKECNSGAKGRWHQKA